MYFETTSKANLDVFGLLRDRYQLIGFYLYTSQYT